MEFIQAHSSNYRKGRSDSIKFIVIHYVGSLGSAKANVEYFANNSNRSASAHYFVGYNGEIIQSVKDSDTAWHCGASSYKHPYCRNANSIGIEMCVKKLSSKTMNAEDKDWYFEYPTVEATIQLTRQLMEKYSVPVERVIRHYDVTGKLCPAPYVHDGAAWAAFKAKLISVENISDTQNTKDDQEDKNMNEDSLRFKTIDQVPTALRPETQQLIDSGALKGSGSDAGLDVSEDMLRCMIISKRYADSLASK